MKTVPLVRHAMKRAPVRARRADPVVGAYWKLLEKRSAWMPG
jgi:hypothetical protein